MRRRRGRRRKRRGKGRRRKNGGWAIIASGKEEDGSGGRRWKRRSVGRKRYSRDSSSAKSGVYEDESPSGVFGFVRCLPSTAPFSSIIANSSSKSAIVRFIAIRTRRRSTVRCVQCLVPRWSSARLHHAEPWIRCRLLFRLVIKSR